MKNCALILLLIAGPIALAQSANDKCIQGNCTGFGPPIGTCTSTNIYTDRSQFPPVAYSCNAGAWVMQGGASGGVPLTNDVSAPAGGGPATVNSVGGQSAATIASAAVKVMGTSGTLGGVSAGSVPLRTASGIITIDPATDTQPGAMTMSDHTALPGMSPVGHETSGLYNGVTNLFNSATYCPPSLGCSVQMPLSYPFNSVSGYGNYGWGNGFNQKGQVFSSSSGGQHKFWHNNPTAISTFDSPAGIDNETVFWAFDNHDHKAIENFLVDSSPGVNNGYLSSQVLAQGGWTGHYGVRQDLLYQGAGIKGMYDGVLACPGAGDCHNYWYIRGYGGFRTPGDEAEQGLAMHVDQYNSQYIGTITSVSGAIVTTSLLSGSFNDIGAQRLAIDTTASSRIFSGYVTGRSNVGDSNGGSYEILTLGGGTVTPSKYWGTLDADIDVPTVPLTYLGTSTTFGFTQTGGAGAPTVGDYINLSQPYSETVKVTGVTSPSSGHYQITAYIRRDHTHGAVEYESVYAHAAFSFADNTSASDNIPYYWDMVGATDSTHVVITAYAQGHLTNPELNNGFGNVSLASETIATMSNTSGVVTAYFYDNYPDARFYNYPTATFRGSATSAFNGQCLNVRNLHFDPGSGAMIINCDQASSTGLSSPYPDNASLTFGTTGYGNTQATIAPAAEILDVNKYPDPVACLSAGNGACEPTVSGTLHLEPNAMPMPTNGTILVAHDYDMLIDGVDIYESISNPMVLGNGLVVGLGGDGMNANRTFGIFNNVTPSTSFIGFGGKHSIPTGVQFLGLFADTIKLNAPPAQNGSVINITGCTSTPYNCSTAYSYNFIKAVTAAGFASFSLNPSTNTLALTAPNITLGGLVASPITTIASASSITPASQIVTITGTAAIATAVVPSTYGTSLGACFDALATGAWTTTTAGNIYATMTAVANTQYRWCYMGDSKWHIK